MTKLNIYRSCGLNIILYSAFQPDTGIPFAKLYQGASLYEIQKVCLNDGCSVFQTYVIQNCVPAAEYSMIATF